MWHKSFCKTGNQHPERCKRFRHPGQKASQGSRTDRVLHSQEVYAIKIQVDFFCFIKSEVILHNVYVHCQKLSQQFWYAMLTLD